MGRVSVLLSYLRFARALRAKPFALLWIGQTVSILGDNAFKTALAWQVLILTGSGTAISAVIIAQTIPYVLFVLVGGVIADRIPRRTIMLCSDISRAVIVLLVAWLGWVHLLQLWYVIVLAIIFGTVDSFFTPAYQALQPQLVDVEALPSANALFGLSSQIGQFLGPLIGAGLVASFGAASAFAFDGASFVISTLCLIKLTVPNMIVKSSIDQPCEGLSDVKEKQSVLTENRSFGVELREGLYYVLSTNWLWVSILIAAVVNLGLAGSLQIALPKLVYDLYPQGVWLLGIIAAAGACGATVASVVIGQIHHFRRRGIFAYMSLAFAGLALVAFGVPFPLFSEPWIISMASAIVSFGVNAFGIVWTTVMQELVPSNMLGRVTSIDWFGSFCLAPLGYAAAGLFSDHLGPGSVFVAGGVLIFVLCCLALFVRDIRRLD